MIRNPLHDLYSSFVLFFDHTLLQDGQAFTNTTGKLYKMTDPNLSGSYIYGSPYKQWIYDSSVSGAVVPSGITVNGNFIDRSSGIKLDFQNGRAISSGNLGNNVSGAYSSKDFNIYTTTKSDYELIFETRYLVNPTIPQVATGVEYDKLVAPCIFLKMKGFENEVLAFGGENSTNINMRAVILADSEYMANAVGNIFIDKYQYNFLALTGTPLNRYNDIKNGYYNFSHTCHDQFDQSRLAFIESVRFNNFAQSSISDKFPDLSVAFLDFTIIWNRFFDYT